MRTRKSTTPQKQLLPVKKGDKLRDCDPRQHGVEIEQQVYPIYLRAWIDARLGQASVSYIAEPRVAAAFALALHDATQHRLKTAQELRAALDEMFAEVNA